MRIFTECWIAENLTGSALTDAQVAYRVSRVNYKEVKVCMTQLASWSRKSYWEPWGDACRAMRDEIMKKTDGYYHTYAQVFRGLDLLRLQATTGVRNMVNNGESQVTLEDAKAFDADLRKWMVTCWTSNGLPVLEDAPKDNEVFYASGLEPMATLATTSTRTPPRDRSQPVSPALPSAKKAKLEKKASATDIDGLSSSIKQEKKVNITMELPGTSERREERAPRETSMHVTRNAVGVLVKAKCHGLNIDLIVIPPFPLATGLKSNGEMAAMVFRETQAEKSALTPPVAASVRCTHNDGKTWRCPNRCAEGLPFCMKHRPRSVATMARVKPVTFQTPNGLSIMYDGPPAACVVRSVAGTPIDALDVLMLKDAENLEAHAWEIETQLQSAEGYVRQDDGEGKFRANALVRERDSVWVPYPQYEARLLTLLPGTPSGATPASDTIFNATIEEIRTINAARVAKKDTPVDDVSVVKSEKDSPQCEREVQKKKVPTGCQDVRRRLAELHHQLNGVNREIMAMKDTGKEHVAAHGRPTSVPTESEYDLFEQSVNRALAAV